MAITKALVSVSVSTKPLLPRFSCDPASHRVTIIVELSTEQPGMGVGHQSA